LSHDCSTLGGNSGSCIVDLSTNSVVGLHFEGDYLVANSAVLLPALAARPEFRGLNWQAGRDA
jgi:V8-like Glu-specific endopeptidase